MSASALLAHAGSKSGTLWPGDLHLRLSDQRVKSSTRWTTFGRGLSQTARRSLGIGLGSETGGLVMWPWFSRSRPAKGEHLLHGLTGVVRQNAFVTSPVAVGAR